MHGSRNKSPGGFFFKYIEQNKMKIQHIIICGMANTIQFNKIGEFILLNAYLGIILLGRK